MVAGGTGGAGTEGINGEADSEGIRGGDVVDNNGVEVTGWTRGDIRGVLDWIEDVRTPGTNGATVTGCISGGDTSFAVGVSDRTPLGTIGSTGMAPGIGTESFLFPGGSNSGGKTAGIAYFSKAL